MVVVWTNRAIINLGEIVDYLKSRDPNAADRIKFDLIAAARSLEEFPDRGRPVDGTVRELVTVWPYIIRYRVEGTDVRVLFVVHGAQRRDGSV